MRIGYTAIGLFLSTLILVPCAASDEPKHQDDDAVCDASKLPPDHLAPLLVSSEGRRILALGGIRLASKPSC